MTKSIAVAGKGGTGKSTIAALLISRLVHKGMNPVLAVDADPDCNLGTLLGIEPEQTIGDLREDLLKTIKEFPAGMTKANYIESGLHQIIEEREGWDLVTMGKGEGASCYCYINSLIRKFCDDLTPSYRWVVIDNEAGLEHLSRRTTTNIDALIVVVSESPLSFSCAAKIKDIVSEMNGRITNTFVVSSMVNKNRLDEVHKRIDELGMDFLTDIPKEEEIEDLVFNSLPISSLKSKAVLSAIDRIIEKIGGNNENT
ncbi:MAG: AAA family ATPase [Spirochaetales bacterium]|nr:AAA family ATPase [Spirochaetales bacterium]